VRVVERILAGEPFFASAGAECQFVEAPECVPVQFLLTSRELQVLQMLMAGKSNKELAALLEMSVRTAESHHPNMMEKFRVESPGDLVRLAVRDHVG
jgi:DNA-binding CsgD family transcriptional regulator